MFVVVVRGIKGRKEPLVQEDCLARKEKKVTEGIKASKDQKGQMYGG